MEKNQIITKSNWKEIFTEFGIKSGSVVCIQGNISRFGNVLDGYQSIIDALIEIVGKNGCIMMPTFTYTCLDPSCKSVQGYPYESWKDVREEMKGYNSKLTPSSVYKEMAHQFLSYEKVIRSEHPVYSFAYLGNVDESWLKQTMNYPVSFVHVLKPFASKNAFNLLFGIGKEESILIPAIAKTLNQGITEVQRGYVNKGKQNQAKTYLNLRVDPEYKEEIMKMCHCESKEVNFQAVHCVTLDNE